jgi:kinesin family protein C2/C3
MGEIRIKRLEDDLRTLQKELFSNGGDTAVVTQMTRLSSLAGTEKGLDIIAEDEVQGKRVIDIIESRDHKLMAEELKSLEKKCNGQREYNAQLLSKMLHLQGNIQVYCRLRPMTITEVQNGFKSVCESLSETEVGCFDNRTNKWKSFAFDRVWGPDQSQQSVFQDVEPLALSVVDGFNACIFAYGQTGSGKTFTMEGSQENNQYGISYRTIQKIFHLLKLRAQQQRAAEMFVGNENEDEPAKEVAFSFSLQLGMLEIYNDEIYDLLNTAGSSMAEKKEGAMRAGGKASLDIRRNKEGRVEVPDLTKEKVNSIQEVMDLLKRGNSNRATASTDMNEHSSRSHMVLMVDVFSGLDDTTPSNKGTLYLVDLAGSERVRKSNVEGDQLKEAGFINKSLSALGNVMEALDRKASHVPFRDSKLTYMLQDSLGGNSRTMMVVTVNPTDNSYDESVHALQFATRVRHIQIGSAKRNVTSKNLEETVKALTDEMRSLSRAKERTESQLHSLKRDNARVQDKLQNLSKSKTQSRSDNKTLDMIRQNNDDMAARWKKEKTGREEASEELDKASKELRLVQQQLGKANSKMKGLEHKLDDNERELELAGKELRLQKTDSSAATLRSRRAQVLSSRRREPAAKSQASTVLSTPASPASTPSAVPTAMTPSAVANKDSVTEEPSNEVTQIRSKVLELLEQYDEGKVNRIDIIMDKFKGKEALLLEKMTQRYQAGAALPATSVQKRNEMALERHRIRMQKIREKKEQNGTGPI